LLAGFQNQKEQQAEIKNFNSFAVKGQKCSFLIYFFHPEKHPPPKKNQNKQKEPNQNKTEKKPTPN